MEIPIILYSNSEYFDILKIQNDYLKNYTNKILLINKVPDFELFFDKIIIYNDNLNYSKRLYNSLKDLNFNYILFFHDIDLLVKINKNDLNDILKSVYKIDLSKIFNDSTSFIKKFPAS